MQKMFVSEAEWKIFEFKIEEERDRLQREKARWQRTFERRERERR